MQKTNERKQLKKTNVYRIFIELVAVGSVTGIVVGAIVTLFNILVHEGESISRDVYAYVRANPAFIPLLVLGLVAGAFAIGVLVNISSVIRGCGVPQAEGATRGIVRFKWWRDLIAMFTASLLSIFMGLSIGAEGPSVLIGAAAGDGVASTLRRNQMIRKYQITGGACTGLAVASNAPLTGMAFAFEEAHKRFTPEVFICAFSSVVFGILTRTVIYNLLNMEIVSAFHSYVFHEMPMKYYGYVVLAGLVCGFLGFGFTKLCFFMRKLFRMLRVKNDWWTHVSRVITAVLIGGAISLVSALVMGGGHELIESLGTHGGVSEYVKESILGLPLLWTLMIVLVLKILVTSVNVGSGIPCGIFIPVIAIGACVGAMLNNVWLEIDPAVASYCDLLVMICMAAFFTTVVRAPITAIVMICEFTGSFAPLLPVIIAVSIGYIIGEMLRTDGIYEELLEAYEEETGIHERAEKIVFTFTLASGSIAEKREVRDVLWPGNARVREILRGEEHILPDGGTVLRAGDVLTVVVTTDESEKIKDELLHIVS
ncbi:MAG: ClC family H(+)/Cl(-) exchange transporter [Clostridia bacterium]|nr:ClC family H(+)/Cl(-) exchange transporter [Clostridia bacterium]